MKLLLSNRMSTWGAIGLIGILIFNNYSDYKKRPIPTQYTMPGKSPKIPQKKNQKFAAKHSLSFDLDKKYENYSLVEKTIYKIFQNDILDMRKQKEQKMQHSRS